VSACRWCKQDHGDAQVWHRTCLICGVQYELRRRVARPRETCGDRLCVAIQRYRWHFGRWPPHVWFERYAVAAGLVKLPKKVEKLAKGRVQPQRDLFAEGAA
jgi:hypothetical protein